MSIRKMQMQRGVGTTRGGLPLQGGLSRRHWDSDTSPRHPAGTFLPAAAHPQAGLLTHRPVAAWLQEQSDLIHQDRKGDLVEHRAGPSLLCSGGR